MKFLDIDGLQLGVEDRGSGPVLLLVHGFPLDHTMWAGQIADLAESARVIAPDLRGFGESDVTHGQVTMDRFADDLAALLDALAIREPVTLCGLSMGGYIAFSFWRRHRERLARLILSDTRAPADTDEARQNRLTMADKVLDVGSAVVVRTMLPGLVAPETPEKQPAVVEQLEEMIGRASPHAIAAGQRGMAAREDSSQILSRIEVPVLVICGEHDTISPPSEMRDLARAIPNSHYVEIPAAGHMSPLEDPAAFNAAVRDFLTQ